MMNVVVFGYPGVWEILLIVLALLLVFGGRKIPEIMKGFGKGIKEFKDATGSGKTEEESNNKDSLHDKNKSE